MKKRNKINTGKSKIGAFTRAAKKAGMPEQEFAKKVLNNKYNYSPEIIKKANFISTVAKWEKKKGGILSKNITNSKRKGGPVKYQDGKYIPVDYSGFGSIDSPASESTSTVAPILTNAQKKAVALQDMWNALTDKEKEKVTAINHFKQINSKALRTTDAPITLKDSERVLKNWEDRGKPYTWALQQKIDKVEADKAILNEAGRVALLNNENKGRKSIGQEKTAWNTLMAGVQAGPGMVYSAGLQGIKGLTGSDGGADWSKIQPDFYGIRNNPAYEGQDYSLSKAINDKWAKENPGFAGLIDIGVPLVGGVGWNKAAKLVDNTLDFANAAKGGLGAMPGGFTRSSNVPRSVIVNNKINENINNLEKQVSNLKNQEALGEKIRMETFADYKAKKISVAEFKTKVKELGVPELMQKRHNLEAQIKALKIKQDIAHAPQKNILHSESQLGKNISDGGSNTKGVFEVGNDYVARLSNNGWRDHANKLLNYSNRIKSPRTGRTLQVKELNGNVYQVQNKVTGTPVLKLSDKEIQNIPQHHIDNFWKDKAELDNLGLSIDVSGGKSNVYYDKIKGFQIIDIGIGASPSKKVVEEVYKAVRAKPNANTANQLNRNLSDVTTEAALIEVKPNANRYENIIETNPLSQTQARNLVEQGRIDEIYGSFKEGADTIDDFKKSYLKDLISDEGIKRLIAQEADYLRSIGIPESQIAKKAEIAAFARINEIKNIGNINRKISEGQLELSSVVDNPSNFNNARFRSPNYRDIFDDVLNPKSKQQASFFSPLDPSNSITPVRIGEKSAPGQTALGTTYSKSIPTTAHEIVGHGLQADRLLPVDNRLKKLEVNIDDLNAYEKKAYEYFMRGSSGKEPSAFLHEFREAMLQAGLIKNRYQNITPKLIKMAKTYFDRRPSGIVNKGDISFNSSTRIIDFIKPTESNFELLARELNKLPLAIPAIGTAGLLNQQQYKKGGQVKKDLKGTYTSSAQRLMDDNDLDPSYITASNENGRIYKGDVSKALKSLNNYGAGFPNALDYKKVGVLPKNKIKYSKNTLIGPVGMPPYRWKSYKTPIFNHGGQIPHQGTKVSMKMLDKNDMLPPNDSDRLSYRDRPVGMSLTMSKTIKSPMQVIQYDDGGNIARTEDEFKEGLNAGKNVFPFGQKGLKKMTSTPPSGDMEVPINMKGFTDGEQTDEQVMLPGEDVNVDGDTIVETPDLSSMDLNKAFDYANSKKFPIFMWKGNEYKLKRHLKKKQRGGLFSNKVTDHVKLNPGFSPDVK